MLGFEQERIMQEAERFLGKRPGSTLMEPQQQDQGVPAAVPSPKGMVPEVTMDDADDFFKNLADANEKQKADEAAAAVAAAAAAAAVAEMVPAAKAGGSSDWCEGPELLIKQSLLVGNLPAAVECCFKSGKLAEGLLLASGGGTTLWTRARDEYLRLQNDVFLTTVGNIMTNDFENLVLNSNLANWMETLAIIATYAADQYPKLCELLAERLEKEKFDTRSAVICYICAKNFPKTVQIWSNTCGGSFGSKKLALADLVEKMAVLQEATKFDQADPLFNAKISQYAEILANSGRLTAAMRYLCLLRDDASSAILRDRIYNAAPVQMGQMFGRGPPCPYEMVDVRILYQPPAQTPTMGHQAMGHQAHQPAHQPAHSPQHQQQHQQGHMGPGPQGGGFGMQHGGGAHMPPRPQYAGPSTAMPPAPNMNAAGPGAYPPHGQAPHAPAPAPQPCPQPAPCLPPRPAMHMPPAPNVGQPQQPTGMCGGAQGGMPPQPMPQPQPMVPQPMQPNYGSSGVLPPGQMSGMNPGGGMPPMPAKAASAAPPQPMGQAPPGGNPAAPSKPAANTPMGEPMAPHDLEHCKSVFGMLLDVSSQDGNVKKREDNAKRLEDLFTKLSSGMMKTASQQKVIQIVKAIEAQDFANAKAVHKELTNSDWDTNKNWLVGVQRLIQR